MIVKHNEISQDEFLQDELAESILYEILNTLSSEHKIVQILHLVDWEKTGISHEQLLLWWNKRREYQ